MITNRGKFNLLARAFRGAARPSNYFVALCTNANPPTVDTNLFGELSEIASGNGYTAGGIALTPGVVDFDTLTEDDTGDFAALQIKNLIWTAVGGPLPSAGSGARWAVLRSDLNAGLHAIDSADCEVEAYWDLEADRVVSVGQSLSLIDTELRLENPPPL